MSDDETEKQTEEAAEKLKANLIEAVSLNAILYDKSHAEYKNTRKCNKIWKTIVKDLGYQSRCLSPYY